MKTAADDARKARRAKAIDLRIQGKTYRQIAAKLRVSVKTAYQDVSAELAAVAEQAAENAKEQLAIELSRLDAAAELAMSEISKKNLAAIDRLAKVNDRRAKLLGLEQTRIELTGNVEMVSPAAARELMRAAFGSVGASDEDGGGIGTDQADAEGTASGTGSGTE